MASQNKNKEEIKKSKCEHDYTKMQGWHYKECWKCGKIVNTWTGEEIINQLNQEK